MCALTDCPLCQHTGGKLLWENSQLRVVLVNEGSSGQDYPGFTRVIWQQHVAEMSDLSQPDQILLMQTVFWIERVMREQLSPDKINLASLGNQVPHLHWHIIPRWHTDSHFPNPVWASPVRTASATDLATPERLQCYIEALSDNLATTYTLRT